MKLFIVIIITGIKFLLFLISFSVLYQLMAYYLLFYLIHRTVAATNMNETSSRSHAIFSIVFTQRK